MVMKLGSVDFTRGINAITDRRLMPDGNVAFADNVDLRSGSIRPFNLPQCYATVTVPVGSTCLFEFRNNWYFSSAHREYVCEVTESQERIYFSEDGPGHIAPSKTVNGETAVLGTIVPTIPPVVKETTKETVSHISISSSMTGGSLSSGNYSYRISAIVGGKILPPCQSISATIAHDLTGINTYNGSISITWTPVTGASGYIIFGRNAGEEQTLITLGPTNQWVDVGSISGSGTYASNYDSNNPLRYVYTYVRTVGSMEDESGPSPVSKPFDSGKIRVVYNNPINDGLVDTSSLQTVSNSAIFTVYVEPINGGLDKGNRSIFTIADEVDQRVWWASGMQALVRLDSTGDLTPATSFTIPAALPVPTLATPTLLSSDNTTLINDTYVYAVTAIRGATSPVSGSAAQTTLSNTQSVTISGAIRGWLSSTITGTYNTSGNQDGKATGGAVGTVYGPYVNYVDAGGVIYFTENRGGEFYHGGPYHWGALRTVSNGNISTVVGGSDSDIVIPTNYEMARLQPSFALPLGNGKILLGGSGGGGIAIWDGSSLTSLSNRKAVFVPGQPIMPLIIYPGYACQNTNGIYLADDTTIMKLSIYYSDNSFNAFTVASGFTNIMGITSDSSGNLYVTDSTYIKKISTSGSVTVLAGNGTPDLVDGTGSGASLRNPAGICCNTDGKLYFSDFSAIRSCTTSTGTVSLVVGNYAGTQGYQDGTGGSVLLSGQNSLVNDASGNIYIGDGHTIRKLVGTTVTTLAGMNGTYGHQDGGAVAATFYYPHGIVFDTQGNAFVLSKYCIRKLSPDGSSVTFAGQPDTQTLYINGTTYNGVGTQALFNNPLDIAIDSKNNLYVLDGTPSASSGVSYRVQVRKITPDGTVTTYGTMLDTGMGIHLGDTTPRGICVDANDNVYVSAGTVISQIDGLGTGYIRAGTYGTSGNLDNVNAWTGTFTTPGAMCSDSNGNLFVADYGAIRLLKNGSGMTTILGQVGVYGHADGSGTSASMLVQGMTYNNGYIYCSEPYCIRRITLGTFPYNNAILDTISARTHYASSGYHNGLTPPSGADPVYYYNTANTVCGISYSQQYGGVWICDVNNQLIRGLKYVASGKTVSLSWNAVTDADGYAVYRTYGGTSYRVATIAGQANAYVDNGSYETIASPPTNNETGGTYSRVLVTSSGDVPLANATIDSSAMFYLCRTDFPNTGTPALTNKETIYVTSSTNTDLTGVQKAFLWISALPTTYDSTKFFLPVYTGASSSITYAGAGSLITTLKSWRIYRSGDTGSQFSFVAEVPISKTSYTDNLGATDLGGTIPTSYVDAGNALVTFAPPPTDLHGLELYNGMLFGISGNTVRWSPTGVPDAWPVAYSITFPFRPLRLKSFAGGLVVLCEDGIYRIDGYDPSSIQQTKTRADGCIAPHSVQISDGRLLYLAKRGIMEFSGMDAVCLTEMMIPYKLMLSPSTYLTGYSAPNSWWYPTAYQATSWACLKAGKSTVSYQDDDLPGSSPARIATVMNLDNPIPGVVDAIRSFVWQNKYFLYYVMGSNYEANACWCVDLTLPGNPVTTLGIRPLDVHVSADGECYMLLKDWSSAPAVDPVTAFLSAAAQFDVPYSSSVPTQDHISVYKFNPTLGQPAPVRFRTREFTAGSPNLRKRWREVRVHGDGTCQMRVFVDGALKQLANGEWWGNIDCAENPNQPRRLLLPPASWGYALSVEIVGTIDVRMIEIGYDAMPGDM